jgi:hypothetical protein
VTEATDLAPVEWFSFEDRCIASHPGRWRRELRPVLRGFAGRQRADDVLLAASELVSNGVEHAGGVEALRVTGSAGAVRVEVEDRMPNMVDPAGQSAERGRGLGITAAISDSWGWHATARGKVVWASFDRYAAAAPLDGQPGSRRAG